MVTPQDKAQMAPVHRLSSAQKLHAQFYTFVPWGTHHFYVSKSYLIIIYSNIWTFIKVIFHPKNLILSLNNYSCRSKPIWPSFIFGTQIKCSFLFFGWNLRAFWPCIDSNAATRFKAQKGSKGIIKIVQLFNRNLRFLRFNRKYLNLCSEDDWRSYVFGTTWRWVINYIIFHFWVNYPFYSY